MDLRRNNPKRTIIEIAPLLEEQVYYLVPLGSGAINIIRSFLVGYGDWRTSYTRGQINHYQYELPSYGEMDIIRELVDEAIYCLQGDGLMPCLELNESLQDINTTVGSLSTTLSGDLQAITAKLDDLITLLTTQNLTDELDEIEPILDSINTILGAAAILGA